ncbi:MAG: hypothetical protein GVY02_04460, partial [Bacteroidetes bacterium]|nr:hypothetical protein [Bacteroidota bacterium]
FIVSCSSPDSSSDRIGWDAGLDSADAVMSIDGFSGPEAVRYDPDQDVYFVANFNGDAAGDANGFISRLAADGTIDSLRFMTGTEEFPLHGPRGMYITADTLWAADADGIHGFNRLTGEQVRFIDFTNFVPGFLNDITRGTDGILYITDTGNSVLYQIEDGIPSVRVNSLPSPPNGVATDSSGMIVLAPWGGDQVFYALDNESSGVTEYASAQSGGNFDGIVFIDGYLLASSQADSSLHAINGEEDLIFIHTPGRGADIGIDTQRRRVAVPYIDLNRVDIWELPPASVHD